MQLYFWPFNPKASQLCQHYVAQCWSLSWTDSSFLSAVPPQHRQHTTTATLPVQQARMWEMWDQIHEAQQEIKSVLWYPQLWSLAHNSFQSRTSRPGPAVQNPLHVWGCKANITGTREAARTEMPQVKLQGFSTFKRVSALKAVSHHQMLGDRESERTYTGLNKGILEYKLIGSLILHKNAHQSKQAVWSHTVDTLKQEHTLNNCFFLSLLCKG